MNPKDMTNEDLFGACISAVRAWPDSRTTYEGDHLWATYTVTRAELLRRLDEADALRKVNEELHKALDYVTSFISIEDVGDEVASPGVVVSSERLEEHATINGVLGFDKCEHPFAQPVIDVLMRAAKAKGSEASHA